MTSFQTYLNFTCNLLCPLNPAAVDKYLLDNLQTIKTVSRELLQEIDYSPTPIYRGVVLRDPITTLRPHPNFTYLSFSEDHNIAENFADTTDTGFPSVMHLGTYGYIIEHTPTPDEIIFHYKFLDLLPITTLLIRAGFHDTTDESLAIQKEVTILQPRRPFARVRPFEKYHDYKPYPFYK